MEATITNAAADVRASNFIGSVEAIRQVYSAPAPKPTKVSANCRISSLLAKTIREMIAGAELVSLTMTHVDFDHIGSGRIFDAIQSLYRSANRPRDRWVAATPLPSFVREQGDSARIFDAIQRLYLSINRPRDRQIAERITELHRVVLAEGEHILPASLEQFTDFFLSHPGLGFPRITMTPDGTLRTRWVSGPENFVAVEFTGKPLVRMVAELPRGGHTAAYFASEPVETVVASSRALGASFE